MQKQTKNSARTNARWAKRGLSAFLRAMKTRPGAKCALPRPMQCNALSVYKGCTSLLGAGTVHIRGVLSWGFLQGKATVGLLRLQHRRPQGLCQSHAKTSAGCRKKSYINSHDVAISLKLV